jgi:hypothetical protein
MKEQFSIFSGQHSHHITAPLWPALETKMRNRFTTPTSLKQLEDVYQAKLYRNPLETSYWIGGQMKVTEIAFNSSTHFFMFMWFLKNN